MMMEQQLEIRSTASVTLPLLSSSNKPSEILLGAALALGDMDLVRAIQLRIKHSPGLGLTKLSPESVRFIQDAFKQWICNVPAGLVGKDLFPLMGFGLLNEKARRGAPSLTVFEAKDPATASALQEQAERLGMFITPMEHFHKTSDFYRREPKVMYTRLHQQRQPPLGGRLIISNCPRLTKFSIRFNVVSETSGQLDLSKIDILRYSGNKVTKPNQDGVIHLVASTLVGQRAEVASERLGYLVDKSSGRGVSFEHIAAHCGYDGDLLQQLAEGDIAMIAHNKAKIGGTIASTLESCVPSPDRHIESDGPPTDALRGEIAVFVDQYLQLLNLTYCDIPRIGGLQPSAFVNETRVSDEESKEVFQGRPARLVHGISRTMEKEERNR